MNTTPSILDTFLTAFRDHTSATCGLDDRIARLTAELDRVPESAPIACGYLVMEISRAEVDRDTAGRSIALRTALIYGLRTGKDGECNIDKPPIWPKGPPTKAESAARGNAEIGPPADPPAPETPVETGTTAPEDAPPDDDASGLAAAFATANEWASCDARHAAIDHARLWRFATANEWASCDAGKARGHAISVLGYTANELVRLDDVQIHTICKHRVGPAEFGGVVVGGVMVDGVTWLLEAPARVVAP